MELYRERDQFPPRYYNFDEDLDYFCRPTHIPPPPRPRPTDENVDLKPLIKQIEELKQKIELLNKTDGTPGSIEYIVRDIVSKMDISDLAKEEILTIYGGSATDVMREVEQ